jgi:hypothetical protein
MDEFPRDLCSGDPDATTRIICPDCGGNITVRALGEDFSDCKRLCFHAGLDTRIRSTSC